MVKCQSRGFAFPSRSVSFDDRQSFDTASIPNNIIEEICAQCNKTMIVVITQGIFERLTFLKIIPTRRLTHRFFVPSPG
ncbi:MAG: hypothetical protein M3250_07550 [Thermoproteota archaeon]|nr:hypothetical protein [Thermoproteota archaeon]